MMKGKLQTTLQGGHSLSRKIPHGVPDLMLVPFPTSVDTPHINDTKEMYLFPNWKSVAMHFLVYL